MQFMNQNLVRTSLQYSNTFHIMDSSNKGTNPCKFVTLHDVGFTVNLVGLQVQ